MNNHLQLYRILLLQIHGKLKPISILSPLQRNLSRSCWQCPGGCCVPWAGHLSLAAEQVREGWMLCCHPARGGRDLVGAEAWSSIPESVWDRGCWGVKSLWEGRLKVTCGPWPSGTQICSLCKSQSSKIYWKSHPRVPASLEMSLYRSWCVAKVGGLSLPLADVGGCHSKKELSCKSVFLPLQDYFSFL